MAVMVSDFSFVLTCPMVSMLPIDNPRRCPVADQVDRLLHRSPVMGTAHRPFGFAQDRPAVDDHHLSGHEAATAPGPAGKTVAGNCRGRERREAGPERCGTISPCPCRTSPLRPRNPRRKARPRWQRLRVPATAAARFAPSEDTQAPKALHDRCSRFIHHHSPQITPPLKPTHSSTSLSLRRHSPANPGGRALMCRA